MARKVALYARVSTQDQDAAPQLAELRRWAEREEFTVAMAEVDTLSGRSTSRPGLDRVVKAARARHVQAVAVVKVDRFGRSVAHAAGLVQQLHDRGVAFFATDQGIRIDPKAKGMEAASGKLTLHVMQAMAEFEADLISERTKVALEARRATGARLGRPAKPCWQCGGPRDAEVWGKRGGRRRPLCASCKAEGSGKGSPIDQGGEPPDSGGLENGRFPTPGGGV